MDDHARCKARSSRTGERCKKARMRGATVCGSHGGRASQVKAAARRRTEESAAERAVATYGLPREIDPHDALLEEVHRTAGHVAWLHGIIVDLEQDDLVWGRTKSGEERGAAVELEEAAPSVWLELYHRERAHLARVAKAALDAGIDERRVKIAEQHAQRFAEAQRAILAELGVEVTEEVREIVGRHLRAV